MRNFIKFGGLFLMLAVLPLGSFYYLYQGRQYFRENMEMLKPKGQISDFEHLSTLGDTVSTIKMTGNVWLANWLPNDCKDCGSSIKALDLISQQFHERSNAKVLTYLENLSIAPADFYKKNNIDSEVKRTDWFLVAAEDSTGISFSEFKKIYQIKSPERHQVVLVDDALNIRNYYDMSKEESLNLLVRHMAMILPKEKRREIGFEREKEK